jgi:hypothetical protein
MKNKPFRILLLALIPCAMLFDACKKDEVLQPEKEYPGYFPAKVGSYIIYDCDSLYYNSFTSLVDTYRFKIKELYESEYIDNAGRNAIRIERWKKEESANWWLKDVWYTVKDTKQVEKGEEDVRMVKLVFPVKEDVEWDINALNSLGKRTVIYKDTHKPYSTGVLSFDSTVTVVNTDPKNLVSEYRNTEIFAMNVGMIYKRFVDVDYVVPTPQIKSGVVFTMRAVEFGNE